MTLPFDGAVTEFLNNGAPKAIREEVEENRKGPILANGYPYETRLDKDDYEKTLKALQIELVKLQAWVKENGRRIVIVFEGRDASGKGGTIKRFRENLNPRVARVVALPKPTDGEATQWYFQRYIAHLPAAGQMVLFDRSWYNRAVVEHVFGFCTPSQREHFLSQLPAFETALVEDGIIFVKLWMNVGRAEQLRRFLEREKDPLKQWKLSWIDIEGLNRWDSYSEAISETLTRTHTSDAPWSVVRSDDKRRARIAAIRVLLSQIDYPGKDPDIAAAPDAKICGGPEMWHG
ncbi:MAG: polyphosphate kinase 2 [Pseudomonadota bacterium]